MKKVIYALFLAIVCIAHSADQDLSERVKHVEGNGGIVYFDEQPQYQFSADSILLECLSIDELMQKKRSIIHAIRNVKDHNEIADKEKLLNDISKCLINKFAKAKTQRKIEKIQFVHSCVELSKLSRDRGKEEKEAAKAKMEAKIAEEQKTKPLPFGRRLFSGEQKLQGSKSVHGLLSQNVDLQVYREDAARSLPPVCAFSTESTQQGLNNEGFVLLNQRLSKGSNGSSRLRRTSSVISMPADATKGFGGMSSDELSSVNVSFPVAQDPIDKRLQEFFDSLDYVHISARGLFGQNPDESDE